MTVRPAKTQISLGIRPVWSESSLCAQWVAKDPSFLHADSEDWLDWANAEYSLGVQSFCCFCHEAAHMCVSGFNSEKARYGRSALSFYQNILYRNCIFFFAIFSTIFSISDNIFLTIHNKMFRVGAKTQVGSGNLKHTYNFFSRCVYKNLYSRQKFNHNYYPFIFCICLKDFFSKQI